MQANIIAFIRDPPKKYIKYLPLITRATKALLPKSCDVKQAFLSMFSSFALLTIGIAPKKSTQKLVHT